MPRLDTMTTTTTRTAPKLTAPQVMALEYYIGLAGRKRPRLRIVKQLVIAGLVTITNPHRGPRSNSPVGRVTTVTPAGRAALEAHNE